LRLPGCNENYRYRYP